MDKFKLTTPVAFIIFNRPECTARVFKEIAEAKPTKLLVIGDGPRENRPGEVERVIKCREILNEVDWPCELLTNFSNINLGCRTRVSSGITWVFSQVEEAIFLEDDCLPHPTFFQFCQELLLRYRHDGRVGMISGDNFQFGYTMNNDSYYFSSINHIWGWATWRSRWESDYDVKLKEWPRIRDGNQINDCFGIYPDHESLASNLERTYRLEVDTWDYQWQFGSRLNGRVAIMPNVNLVSNIGTTDATHKGTDEFCHLPTKPILFPLKHPRGLFASKSMDSRFLRHVLKKSPARRFKSWLKRLL